MSISSDEVNCLIYRYLQENGFTHSAFTFAYESLVIKSSAAQTEIPPGALITFLQKGLEYIAIEEHISEDGTIQEFENNFTLMSPMICEALAVKEDRRIRTAIPPSASSSNLGNASSSQVASSTSATDSSAMEVDNSEEALGSGVEFSAANIAPSSSQVTEKSGTRFLHLKGHQADVHSFSWNPSKKQLATASMDGVSRIWNLGEMTPEKWQSNATELLLTTSLLPHKVSEGQKLYEVSSVAWNSEGTLLATACNDGVGRIWDAQGTLLHQLHQNGHEGAMVSIKWSKNGAYLVSRGMDRQAILWSAVDGKHMRSYTPHQDAGPDVDWKDSDIFATCGGKDHAIALCSVTSADTAPIRKFTHHTNEVNSIAWSPSGMYLASGSDDGTAKIYTVDALKHDLRGDNQAVLTVKWSPASGSNALLLCTGSLGGSVKVWEGETGQLLHSLSKYNTSICSISISAEGKWLAAGTHSGRVSLWSLENGEVVQELRVGKGDNYEVAFSHDSQLLAASFVEGSFVVVDTSDLSSLTALAGNAMST